MKSEHIMNFLKDGSFSMPYYLIQFRKFRGSFPI